MAKGEFDSYSSILYTDDIICQNRQLPYYSRSIYASLSYHSLGERQSTCIGFSDNQRRSFSVLGMVPGVILTVVVAGIVQYTSLVLWRFCLKHPEVRDVCDIGQILFGGSRVAYNVTAIFFILNNTFIRGIIYMMYF
jgi:hypothetical protein